MKCRFSKHTLALLAEGDLPSSEARRASNHLASCEDCRQLVAELNARLLRLKSLRLQTATPSECANMRRGVMSIIDERRNTIGWLLRLERALVLAFHGRSYAIATAAAMCLISVAVVAQMRHGPAMTSPGVPMFEGSDTLLRPDGYRSWIVLQSSSTRAHKVFVSPAAYRGYADTGKFPEGTLMIWERGAGAVSASGTHGMSTTLLASVKDSSRFDGGWGFFDFTAAGGTLTPKAKALPESSGCRTCHRKDT
jgi:hypothetical protein